MEVIQVGIKNLFICQTSVFKDNRGIFVKSFNYDYFKKTLNIQIKEAYYSISKKNVIRGMHFQIPPFENIKLVYVSRGEIEDVVLDIRKKSETFGKFFAFNLSENDGKILVIPPGFAHGFKALKNNTIVNYLQTSCYNPEFDKGIRYDSFGFDWKCVKPIVSKRDLSLPIFTDFKTPF